MKPMRSHFRHTLAVFRCTLLLLALSPVLCAPAAFAQGQELYRVRVTNSAGGPVEVSADGGATFAVVGKVVRPASNLITGFVASRWAAPGSIAGIAVHGVRIKVRNTLPTDPKTASETMMMSLVPREFVTVPKAYGGHRPGNSGIYTDIPTGEAIFRNLAPLVGSPVRLDLGDRLAPFPEEYRPRAGDRIVILAMAPPLPVREIVFENWTGGLISAVFAGRDPQPVARVVRPVLGVGRYDATTYTGIGHVNTNHCGVVTISTAGVSGFMDREGEGDERRGGFQIEPANHAEAVAVEVPQVMVVEPLEGSGPLEGQPPLFSGYIGLYWDRTSPDRSTHVEVRIDNGPWERIPEILGRTDDAFTAAALNEGFRVQGVDRRVTSGVTHLRIVFAQLDQKAIAGFLAAYAPAAPEPAAQVVGTGPGRGTGRPARGGPPVLPPAPVAEPGASVVRGVVTLNVGLKNLGDPARICAMTVYVDGRIVAIMNSTPFRHDLDTRRLTNGRHEVELRALDGESGVVAQRKTVILVDNPVP